MRKVLPDPVRGRTHEQTHKRFTSMKSAATRLKALVNDEHLLSQMINHDYRAKLRKPFRETYSAPDEKAMLAVKKRLQRDIKGVRDILARANEISEDLKHKPKKTLKNASKTNRGYCDELFIGFWRRWIGEKIEFKKRSKFVRLFDSMEKEITGKAWRCPHLDTLKARFARFC